MIGEGQTADAGTTEQTPASGTGQDSATSGGAAPEPSQSPGAAEGGEPAPYTPNTKFKVHDKELEFDPALVPALTNAETEKKIRELHEKAYGLDHVKADRARFSEEARTTKVELTNLQEGVQAVRTLAGNKDFTNLFDVLGVPEKAVLEWAVEVAKRMNDPHKQTAYEQQRAYEQRLYEAQTQASQLQGQNIQYAQQAKQFEVEQVLARPDIASAAQIYNARNSNPDAFKNAMVKVALWHHGQTKTDMTAEQAAKEVMTLAGLVGATHQNAPQTGQPPVFGQPTPQASASGGAKPVIPNIQGRGTSPVAKSPKNLAELRELSRQRSARG